MALCALDRTFCASPNCKNECHAKMTEDERKRIESDKILSGRVSYAYFCSHTDTKDDILNTTQVTKND